MGWLALALVAAASAGEGPAGEPGVPADEPPVEDLPADDPPVPVDTEPPPDAPEPVALPVVPAADALVAPVLALDRARHRRAVRSSVVLLGVSAVEVGLGVVMLARPRDEGFDMGGAALVGMGALHGLDGGLQLDTARRRRASHTARALLADDRGDEAWLAIARDWRRGAERRSRGHALGTGLYVGVAGAGGALLAMGEEDLQGAGLAALVSGAVGAVHHAVRWRSAARLAGDLDTLATRPPWIPPPR